MVLPRPSMVHTSMLDVHIAGRAARPQAGVVASAETFRDVSRPHLPKRGGSRQISIFYLRESGGLAAVSDPRFGFESTGYYPRIESEAKLWI